MERIARNRGNDSASDWKMSRRRFVVTLSYSNGVVPDMQWLEEVMNDLMRRALQEGVFEQRHPQAATLEEIDVMDVLYD